MTRYKIVEGDGTVRIVHAKDLSEAIGMAEVPHSVTIDEECPVNPHHDLIPLTGPGSEGKTEFCRICGLTR